MATCHDSEFNKIRIPDGDAQCLLSGKNLGVICKKLTRDTIRDIVVGVTCLDDGPGGTGVIETPWPEEATLYGTILCPDFGDHPN